MEAGHRTGHSGNCLTNTLRSCCFIPQRVVLGIMGLFGVCNAYTMRVCLNFAITQMVFPHAGSNETNGDPDACTYTPEPNQPFDNPHAMFHWDESTQGLLLSSFYFGYSLTQVLGAYASQKWGGKWILGIGLLSTALFTLLTPPVVKNGGAAGLGILRVLQGMGEGPTMPALMILLSRWVPPHERSVQGAMVFGGAQIGNIFGSYMSGLLLADGRDWVQVFYFFGGVGIVWCILWCIVCYDTPLVHPFIKKSELDYLVKTVTGMKVKPGEERQPDPVPWKAMFRSAPVWALVWAAMGHDWGYYAIVTDLPKYFHDVLKYNIKTAGQLNTLPYIAMWLCSFLLGFICDLCVKKGWHTIKTGRIIHTTIAAAGPAVCIILASYAGCNGTLAIVYFVISMALMAGFYSGMKVNVLDLAPNYAASLTSFVNTSSTLVGMAPPYLIGLMTPDSTLKQWRNAFWVCFIVLTSTNVIYIIWADGKQQWWDDVRKYGYPEGWKHGPLLREDKETEGIWKVFRWFRWFGGK